MSGGRDGSVDDPSVLHADGAGGQCGDGQIVRHEDQGHAQLPVQAEEKFHDLAGIFAVEVAGGLIREQDGRAVGEAAGDGDALSFAAGEFGGKCFSRCSKPTSFSSSSARPARSLGTVAPSNIGIWTFSTTVKVGRR